MGCWKALHLSPDVDGGKSDLHHLRIGSTEFVIGFSGTSRAQVVYHVP